MSSNRDSRVSQLGGSDVLEPIKLVHEIDDEAGATTIYDKENVENGTCTAWITADNSSVISMEDR